MNEFLGLAYYAEIPAVLVDVQRVGPSTECPPEPSRPTCSSAPTRLTATPLHSFIPGASSRVFLSSP